MEDKLKEHPKKIYLQIETLEGDIVPPEEMHECECTWSDERVNESDIIYYRHGNNRHVELEVDEYALFSIIESTIVYKAEGWEKLQEAIAKNINQIVRVNNK